jgi:glycosyltransferase involved in cell wall biosynthesis
MALRIAHFVQRYPPALGGSEAYFQRLSRYLQKAGHTVEVWTTNAIDLEAFWSGRGRITAAGEFDDAGVRVLRFACSRWPLRRYILKALSFLPGDTWKCMTMPCNPISFKMWHEAGRPSERFDVVHASAFPYAWPIICARRLARRCGAKFFITPFLHLGRGDDKHNRGRRGYLAPHLQSLLRSADGIFVQTPTERDAVVALGIGADKVILQGMGVEPSECTGGDRVTPRRSWRVDDKTVVIGHLANLSHEKGTIDLLLAAEQLWKRGVEFHVVLAGPDMPNFRKFWKTYSHQDRVTICGVLDDKQKRDFFSGIDIFALPSRSDSFGLVLLEAWANGVPNVAYRAGGIADVIIDGQDGILVDCGDGNATGSAIANLSKSLSELIASSEMRHRLGSCGRSRVLAEFRWPQKLKIVESLYSCGIGS